MSQAVETVERKSTSIVDISIGDINKKMIYLNNSKAGDIINWVLEKTPIEETSANYETLRNKYEKNSSEVRESDIYSSYNRGNYSVLTVPKRKEQLQSQLIRSPLTKAYLSANVVKVIVETCRKVERNQFLSFQDLKNVQKTFDRELVTQNIGDIDRLYRSLTVDIKRKRDHYAHEENITWLFLDPLETIAGISSTSSPDDRIKRYLLAEVQLDFSRKWKDLRMQWLDKKITYAEYEKKCTHAYNQIYDSLFGKVLEKHD